MGEFEPEKFPSCGEVKRKPEWRNPHVRYYYRALLRTLTYFNRRVGAEARDWRGEQW